MMMHFVTRCKLCGGTEVDVKTTSVQYGARVRCKLRCTSCGLCEELDKEEITLAMRDFLNLEETTPSWKLGKDFFCTFCGQPIVDDHDGTGILFDGSYEKGKEIDLREFKATTIHKAEHRICNRCTGEISRKIYPLL